jgi:hypothetical protein
MSPLHKHNISASRSGLTYPLQLCSDNKTCGSRHTGGVSVYAAPLPSRSDTQSRLKFTSFCPWPARSPEPFCHMFIRTSHDSPPFRTSLHSSSCFSCAQSIMAEIKFRQGKKSEYSLVAQSDHFLFPSPFFSVPFVHITCHTRTSRYLPLYWGSDYWIKWKKVRCHCRHFKADLPV